MYKNDVWNNWTLKSNGIPFTSDTKSIGDGEQKLAAEFGVTPLGQNVAYDIMVNGEKWEIKKLDQDSSFRLGVEVSNKYTPIISSLINIFEKLMSAEHLMLQSPLKVEIVSLINEINTLSGNSRTLLLDGLRKNEVSESNLNKANIIIENIKIKIINNDVKERRLYSSVDGKIYLYTNYVAFKKLMLENIPADVMVKFFGSEEIYNKLFLTNTLSEELMHFQMQTVKEKLNKVVRDLFSEVKLVVVSEKKGYMPITNLNNIVCNRLTSGGPRCKIINNL